MKNFLLSILLLSPVAAFAQRGQISILDSSQDCSIRGMSIPPDNSMWLSGSKGHVGRSTDGGRSWKWTIVPGFGTTDFRDIEAFDSSTAIVMGIGNPAYILKTADGGKSWKEVFRKDAPGMFLDAMDFRNRRDGICIGDPLTGADGSRRFFIVRTRDAGETWQEASEEQRPAAESGEAVFSASGSNIALLEGRKYGYAFISGGTVSNLHLIPRNRRPTKTLRLDMIQGTESSGAFSMATDRRNTFYMVGGDYTKPELGGRTSIWTTDEGKTWSGAKGSSTGGYRSCIAAIDGKRLIACGTNGIDVLLPEAGSWEHVSDDGFNVCKPLQDGRHVLFAGSRGRVAMLRL